MIFVQDFLAWSLCLSHIRPASETQTCSQPALFHTFVHHGFLHARCLFYPNWKPRCLWEACLVLTVGRKTLCSVLVQPSILISLLGFIYLFGFTRSYLWHVGYLVAACKLLVVVCGIQFPTRDRTHAPCIGSQTLSHWPTKEILLSWSLFPCLLLPLAVSSLDLPWMLSVLSAKVDARKNISKWIVLHLLRFPSPQQWYRQNEGEKWIHEPSINWHWLGACLWIPIMSSSFTPYSWVSKFHVCPYFHPWTSSLCGLNHCSAHKLLPHSRSSTNITWSPHSHTHMCQAHVSSFLLNETFPSSSMQSLSTKHNGTSEGSKTWDLSDCPMVKTLHFPCRGQEQGFNMLGGPAKKKSFKTWVTTYRIPHKILYLCAWIQWTAKKNQTKVPGSISRSKCGQHTTCILLA